MARDYELGIVVNPDVGDEQARAIVERITAVIGAQDGQVVRVNAVGRRRLAYPIEHHRDGLYFYFDLALEPQSIAEIERSLRVNEDIIRHLLLVRDPRVVAQQRQREAEALAQAQTQAAQAEAAAANRASAPSEAEETAEETASPVASEPEAISATNGADEVDEASEAGEPEQPEQEVEDEAETEAEANV